MSQDDLINSVIELTQINFDKMVSSNYNDIFIDKENIYDTRQVIKKVGGVQLPDSDDPKRDLGLMQCKKAFLDLMTNMVARETCFKDDNQMYIARFQKLVNTIFYRNIQKYIDYKREKGAILGNNDILFLYKGGTTMKIIFNKYKSILVPKNFNNIFNYLSGDFERSDSDYSILINPDITLENNKVSFEEIYYEVNKLSYLCLIGIRFVFQQLPNYFVPLDLITEDIIKRKLDEMNKSELPKVKARDSCTNVQNINKFIGLSYLGKSYFAPDSPIPNLTREMVDTTFINKNQELLDRDMRIQEFIDNKCLDTKVPDFMMSLTDDNIHKYYRKYEANLKNDMYVSLNESNEYDNNGTLAYFSLHRVKINFVAYYISNDGKFGFFDCPSELIDVSILKKMASGLPLFYGHVEKEQLTYKYSSDEITLNYNSYSLYGHINDLILVLFDVAAYPWEDNKYKKRINRIMFFVLLELCINIKKHALLKQLLVFIRSLSYYGANNALENINNMKQILFEIIKILNNNGHFAAESFFERLLKLTSANLEDPQILEKFQEFFSKINAFMRQIEINQILPVEIDDENTNLTFLGGGVDDIYYRKYLKYKMKYLQLAQSLNNK